MRIRLQHRTAYIYEDPAGAVIQVFRRTPRNYDGQHVRHWRIDLDHDVQMQTTEDAFGNVVNSLSFTRPLDDFSITVQGEVETREIHGVVRGAIERFPAGLYLRETHLTQPDSAIRKFARDSAGTGEQLAQLHNLLAAVHTDMECDPKAAELPATKCLAAQRGTANDMAQVFITAARSLDIPARFVAGYLLRGEDSKYGASVHAWAEAFVPSIGWIGFDPVEGGSPSESHVRVSMALGPVYKHAARRHLRIVARWSASRKELASLS
jgi:transglutaminase-like putative cysteine protease